MKDKAGSTWTMRKLVLLGCTLIFLATAFYVGWGFWLSIGATLVFILPVLLLGIALIILAQHRVAKSSEEETRARAK